jgi:hypothetical protein
MNRNTRFLLASSLAIVGLCVLPVVAVAGGFPTLAAPADVTACVDSASNLNAAWCPVPNATKYSVEVTASYDLGGGCGEQNVDFDFGTDGTSLEIPLSAFDYDFGSGPVAACSLSVAVKGLNPPKGPHGKISQNNPFTWADQNPIDPTVVTCLADDTALDPSCP